MPKTVILRTNRSASDAKYLQELAATSKLAKKCVYVGTYSERFILCYEKRCGKYVYYAVDMLSGRFSYIHESSFEFSESMLIREIGHYLVKAVKHTGCFNPVKGGGKVQKSIWTTASRAEA